MRIFSLQRCKHLLIMFALAIPFDAMALSNSGKVPVLMYHSHYSVAPCDYPHHASMALAQDLELLNSKGFTVVPVYWITQWALGDLDGSALPDKVVGLTFDDGADTDWIDNIIPSHPCAPLKSFRAVLQDFKAAHPSLPWYSPHASSFVIGSPVARSVIFGPYMNDSWWAAANASGLIEIYNHSADHDHITLTSGPYWDPDLSTNIPILGYSSSPSWSGGGNFLGIDNYESSTREIVNSSSYIATKIGAMPDLFAYPNGNASNYLRYTYFPYYTSEHHTYAAYSTVPTYVTRSSERYFMPRISHFTDWTTPAQLSAILDGAP